MNIWITSLAASWMLVAAQSAVDSQLTPSRPAAAQPVVTCESKNPSPTQSVVFAANGVDFSKWIRGFITRVKGNWNVSAIPAGATGCAIISFAILGDGSIDKPVVQNPSATEALTDIAYAAILKSAPFEPLPAGYEKDSAPFTVTFFYNPGQNQATASPLR